MFFVGKTPGDAAIYRLIFIGSLHRLTPGEIGHHVIALDAKAGIHSVVFAARLFHSMTRGRRDVRLCVYLLLKLSTIN